MNIGIQVQPKDKKIALCLGGGAVLGSFHIGVLKAIEELNIKISFLAGTSIGAIVGVLYACGKTADEIEQIALNIKWKDLYTLSISKTGILSNKKIGDFLSRHIDEKNFEDLEKKFGVIATDITTGEKVPLFKGNVKQAVMASSCIPGVFIPIKIENKILVDGGLVENVPISIAKKFKADYIIAVDLNTNQAFSQPSNILEILINSFNFLSINSTKMQIKQADLSIKPDLTKFNPIKTKQIEELIQEGYNYSKPILEKEFNL